MSNLAPINIALALESLPQWQLEEDVKAIGRKFIFPDFAQAFGFMQSIAVKAQQLDHHPEWSNVYNMVDIRWTNHDASGLTERDIGMAKFCDDLFSSTQGRADA